MAFLLALTDMHGVSRTGGFPHTPTWPARADRLLTPVLEIGPELLAPIGVTVPAGMCISVSAALDAIRDLTISDASDVEKLRHLPSSVVLVARSARPLVKHDAPRLHRACGIIVGPKLDEDPEALQCSKLGGEPGWIQDEIPVADETFTLQISGKALLMTGAPEDPFRGGLGYLFLRPVLKKGVVGHFFVQFS